MASEVKTNKLSPSTGTTLSVGDSGDTLALAVDDVTGFNVGSDAQGDVLYHDGTDYTRLAAGTSGLFLKTQGTSANPVWASAGGNNTPTFSAYLASDQTIADATWVKVEFDTISVTDGGTYDNSTDHKWTPGEAGDYVLKANLGLYHVGGNNTDIAGSGVAFYLNGSVMSPEMAFPNYYGYSQNALPGWVHLQADAVVTLGATDYIQVYGYLDHRWTAYTNYVKGDRASYFASYKLIGS